MFNSRNDFITASASEKIILAHVQATTRLITWSLDTGSIYERQVDHWPVALKQGQTVLTKAASYAALAIGTWFYDSVAGMLYVWTTDSTDPSNKEMIVTYRKFYSTAPVTASWDLTNTGNHTYYEARITSSPGFKNKIGIEQSLTSLVGSGDLVLENNDNGLNPIIDTFFFENQDVYIYNWNRDLDFSEAKLIYRGVITNKKNDQDSINLTVRDQIFELNQALPQHTMEDQAGIKDGNTKNLKRWLYGRVDGVKLQSIDQTGDGYSITGTLSSTGNDEIITGVGTLFLTEVSPGDTLIVNDIELDIASVESNTSLTLNEIPDFSFNGAIATLKPEIPVRTKNRIFLVAGHACSRIEKTVVSIIQSNRVQLNNTTDLRVGDYLEFTSGERIQIRRVASGNVIVLQQSLITVPAISSSVLRQPVQNVYISGKRVEEDDYSISNIGGVTQETKITLGVDAEFNITRSKRLTSDLTFTNGTRTVTTTENVDFRTIFSPRDWIKPDNINYTTYYEILSVDTQSLQLRTTFTEANITNEVLYKHIEYVDDDTIVSADVIGRTENGEPTGVWIKTAAQTVKDMITQLGITNINTASFTDVDGKVPHLVSLAFPSSPGSKLTKTKDAIDNVNKSVFASLTQDNDLNLQYRLIQNNVPTSLVRITDADVINWKLSSTNGKAFRNSIINYRFQDVNNLTLESSNLSVSFESEFVRDYVGTDKTDDFQIYLYDTSVATIMAHRQVYFSRLNRTDITIDTDLRFEGIEIGDTVLLDFAKLYTRLGDSASRKKLALVVGKTQTGSGMTIECTDLGNTFNTSAVIAPNTTNDYSVATEEEKLKYGFITDSRGIVENAETTANTNLIS